MHFEMDELELEDSATLRFSSAQDIGSLQIGTMTEGLLQIHSESVHFLLTSCCREKGH